MAPCLWFFVAICSVLNYVALCASNPNIFFILADDLGWGNVGWHRSQPDDEIKTPNMDKLVQEESLDLFRHYVHFVCTPTRTAFQTGRLPVHVTTQLKNPDNPACGIPRNMTGIATKMKQAGYNSHIVGKWDCGMATFNHTPRGRGYDSSLIYFEHKNDYWTQIQMQSACLNVYPNLVDFWMNGEPAYNLNGTKFEELIFADHVYDLIDNMTKDAPSFIVYTPHIAHCPLQIPEQYLNGYNFSNDENNCSAQTPYIYPNENIKPTQFKCRSLYQAAVGLLDEIVGNITTKLKANGMWSNTLLIFSSDNGGSLQLVQSGASNHPMRGGKGSPWEGGVRGTAFVSGGYLAQARRGKIEYGFIHIADWYRTLIELVGGNATDTKAAKYNLPAVDSLNIWSLIIGENNTSPRTELPINSHALIQGDYKYIVGQMKYASWPGEIYPNTSSTIPPTMQHITMDCSTGCLFNIGGTETGDWTEHNNIADTNKDKVQSMAARLKELEKGFYENNEQGENSCPKNVNVSCACWMAKYYWNGYFGPYQYINNVTNNI